MLLSLAQYMTERKHDQKSRADQLFRQAQDLLFGPDEQKGVYHLREAVLLSHNGARELLGFLYIRDTGMVIPNLKAGFDLFLLAANEGDLPDSHYQVGTFYAFGSADVPRDYKLAIKHFTSAIRQGHADAMICLANLLVSCVDEIPPNPARAMSLYRQAAARGHPHAQYMLAACLSVNCQDEVAKRFKLSRKSRHDQIYLLLTTAASSGHKQATKMLARVRARVTRQQQRKQGKIKSKSLQPTQSGHAQKAD